MILLSFVCAVLVAWLTYRLIKIPRVTPTQSSAVISLLFFLILFLIREIYLFDFDYFASLVFGSSFVGMCSHKVFRDREIMLGALIFATIFNFLETYSFGVGGALGLSAFVSLLIVWALSMLLEKRRTGKWSRSELFQHLERSNSL